MWFGDEILSHGPGAARLQRINAGGPLLFNHDMKEKATYSLVRAINASINERLGETNAWKLAGFGREVSNEIAKRSGKSSAGLFMPTNVQFYMDRTAGYSIGTGSGLSATSGGSNLVATNLLAGSFIDLLRNKARTLATLRLVCAGARHYFDQHGIPVMPADLAEHNCLMYQGTGNSAVWPLSDRTENTV